MACAISSRLSGGAGARLREFFLGVWSWREEYSLQRVAWKKFVKALESRQQFRCAKCRWSACSRLRPIPSVTGVSTACAARVRVARVTDSAPPSTRQSPPEQRSAAEGSDSACRANLGALLRGRIFCGRCHCRTTLHTSTPPLPPVVMSDMVPRDG
jgi:hypothetical protein